MDRMNAKPPAINESRRYCSLLCFELFRCTKAAFEALKALRQGINLGVIKGKHGTVLQSLLLCTRTQEDVGVPQNGCSGDDGDTVHVLTNGGFPDGCVALRGFAILKDGQQLRGGRRILQHDVGYLHLEGRLLVFELVRFLSPFLLEGFALFAPAGQDNWVEPRLLVFARPDDGETDVMTVGCTIHLRSGELEIAVTVGTKESAALVSASWKNT
ncbi:hypothetical protein EYF80_007172 [Liparis tanakae]|uniref:Uncharacterized protein n=1 Tax=Liparis tanakae TaxID=230148 RepID=A0A4Z2IYN4_9TELE|nr:hypothetical protein EYF80_007172 [Liparis tanakae]